MKRLFAMLAASVALIAGCSSGPTEGVVHDKKHTGAYTTFMPISNGKTTTIVPMVVSENWELYLCPQGVLSSRDDCGWHDVSSDQYAAAEVGDYFEEARR